MELCVEDGMVVIQIEDNASRILTHNRRGRCIQVAITREAFDNLWRQAASIKAALGETETKVVL